MSRLRERILAVAPCALGALWIAAAVTKIVALRAAFELVARISPAWIDPKAALVVAIAAEAFLGAAMCLRVVRSFAFSAAGIAAVSLVLLAVRSKVGPDAPCGCFGALLGTSVDAALVRNGVLLAAHAALVLASRRPGAK